jgi:ubiquinone/menaquinone biosynthesis C-methylase UbiE
MDAGAQAIPCADATFDGAMMLKSLHHVPMPLMDEALAEVARVVRPGGWLYVSEPIYDGALNEVVRLFNDEGTVRAAAQAAVDRAVAAQRDWTTWADHRFAQAVQFANFADFEKRMMQPSFIDLQISDDIRQRVRTAFEPHQSPNGAAFVRPMLVRLLRRV